MSVQRVLSVLPLIVVLTGCMIEDIKSDVTALKSDIKTLKDRDVMALKGDIKALKAYLAFTPVPDQCKMPGEQDSAKTCLYKLKITDDKEKAKGLYKGRVHPDVYLENAKACPAVNKTLLPEYASLAYECPPLKDDNGNATDFSKRSRWYPDTEIEYTFEVDGHPMMTIGDTAEFESVPGTTHLKKK